MADEKVKHGGCLECGAKPEMLWSRVSRKNPTVSVACCPECWEKGKS